MSEADLLRRIQLLFPPAPRVPPGIGPPGIVPMGIGDDAAALTPTPGKYLLLTTDSLVEGVHFDLSFSTYFQLGRKVVAVNASDIAAMGGVPTSFLVSLGLTPRQTPRDVVALYRGMKAEVGAMAEQAAMPPMSLIGGNLSACKETFWVSVTVVGEVAMNRMLTRAGAGVGDGIYVTHTLGDAAAGLAILQSGKTTGAYRGLIEKYRTPCARVREGSLLATRAIASAMVDLSDGLSSDALRLAAQSNIGMEIETGRLPISPALRRYASEAGGDPLDLACHGGEDYALLFTVPERRRRALATLTQDGRIAATRIGWVVQKSQGCYWRDAAGRRRRITPAGYDHFHQT